MCRSIKLLFNFDPPVTDEEIRAAALQFVRKISGTNKPSKANEVAFGAAVDDIAAISPVRAGSLRQAWPCSLHVTPAPFPASLTGRRLSRNQRPAA
jgi:hypothetical protein